MCDVDMIQVVLFERINCEYLGLARYLFYCRMYKYLYKLKSYSDCFDE